MSKNDRRKSSYFVQNKKHMRSLILLFVVSVMGSLSANARLLESKTPGIGEIKMQLAVAKTSDQTKAISNPLLPIAPLSRYGSRGSGLLTAGIICMAASPGVFIIGGIMAFSPNYRAGEAVMAASGVMLVGGVVMTIVGIVQRSGGGRYSSITPYSGAPNEIGLAYNF